MSSSPRKHCWEDVIDDEIRTIHAGLDMRRTPGRRPAVICIDNQKGIFGDRREPVLEMIRRFPNGCGLAGWDAIEPTQRLVQAARDAGVLVAHSNRDPTPQPPAYRIAATKWKSSFVNVMPDQSDRDWYEPLAPAPGDLRIYKRRASIFYGTPLAAYLTEYGIDTVILCGNTTSGCVRASAVDAFNCGFTVVVVEECTFDRNWLSHKVNLFDLNTKYADVMFLDEVLAYLAGLQAGVSDSVAPAGTSS
jgi:nicotinamidase-related amidase